MTRLMCPGPGRSVSRPPGWRLRERLPSAAKSQCETHDLCSASFSRLHAACERLDPPGWWGKCLKERSRHSKSLGNYARTSLSALVCLELLRRDGPRWSSSCAGARAGMLAFEASGAPGAPGTRTYRSCMPRPPCRKPSDHDFQGRGAAKTISRCFTLIGVKRRPLRVLQVAWRPARNCAEARPFPCA